MFASKGFCTYAAADPPDWVVKSLGTQSVRRRGRQSSCPHSPGRRWLAAGPRSQALLPPQVGRPRGTGPRCGLLGVPWRRQWVARKQRSELNTEHSTPTGPNRLCVCGWAIRRSAVPALVSARTETRPSKCGLGGAVVAAAAECDPEGVTVGMRIPRSRSTTEMRRRRHLAGLLPFAGNMRRSPGLRPWRATNVASARASIAASCSHGPCATSGGVCGSRPAGLPAPSGPGRHDDGCRGPRPLPSRVLAISRRESMPVAKSQVSALRSEPPTETVILHPLLFRKPGNAPWEWQREH